jgi:hypothetical protein
MYPPAVELPADEITVRRRGYDGGMTAVQQRAPLRSLSMSDNVGTAVVMKRAWLAIALGVALGAGVRGDDRTSPWFGTWVLNVGRSTYAPDPLPYKKGRRKIAPGDNGAITIVDDLVRLRGGILHLEWTGKFDGADYPVQGVEVTLTNAFRCSSDRACDVIQKIDGVVVATERIAISPDGRTLTTTAASGSASAALVYDKR